MNLYIDTSAGTLVLSPIATAPCLPPALAVGDLVPVTLSFLQRNAQPLNTGNPVYNYLDFSAQDVVLSIGPINDLPTGGTFELSWGGDTTVPLAFNTSSYMLSVALNELDSITAAGGVGVMGNLGGPYTVMFNETGLRAEITATANALNPACSITVQFDEAGSSTMPSIQVLTLAVAPQASIQPEAWTPQASAAVTVTSLQGNVIQRVAIPAGTYAGSFTLTYNGNTTVALPFNAQIDLVAAALNALAGITGATVLAGQNYWDITIPGGSHALTGSASGLIVPFNLSASLDLSPQPVADMLAGMASATVPILIQTTAADVLTVYQGQITLVAP